jgi:hypothetical protein
LSVEDRQNEGGGFRSSPTGPRVAPPRQPVNEAPPRLPYPGRSRRPIWSVTVFVLVLSGIAIRAYRDLSRPEAWDYWKETYLSPSMTSAVISDVDLDGSGHGRRALAISGTIGAANANWLRDRLDQAHLAAGDAVLLSSRGGSLNQAAIMGEIIRSRALVTAVGTADSSGEVRPAYCASACVLAYAGGKTRYGIDGSMLGVHRFTATTPMNDPVAEAQRVAGMVLSYMTKMGVSSTVVEAMSQTGDVRWLSTKEALAMNLITDRVGRTSAR